MENTILDIRKRAHGLTLEMIKYISLGYAADISHAVSGIKSIYFLLDKVVPESDDFFNEKRDFQILCRDHLFAINPKLK